MLILTSSELSAWRRCPRGWWLKHYRQLQPKGVLRSLPDIGNLVHGALEAHYSGSPQSMPDLIAGRGLKLVEQYPELSQQIYDDCEFAAIMVEGYQQWLEETGADAGLEVIGAEMMLEVPVGPFMLRGKIDARLRRQSDGALLQLEHKTVGNLTDLPKFAQSNWQFLTYDLLAFLKARETGNAELKTDGVIINMLKRVKRTVRARPPFYDRHEVRHNLDELRNHWRHVVAVGTAIERARGWLDEGVSHHDVCPPGDGRDHLYACGCAGITAMFDNGSDVEGYLEANWEHYDPLARYKTEEVA